MRGGVRRAGAQEGGAGPVVVPGVVLQRRPPALLEAGQPGPGQPELPVVTNLEERITKFVRRTTTDSGENIRYDCVKSVYRMNVDDSVMMDLNDDTDNYVDVSDDGDGTLMQKKWKRQFQLPERIVTLDWKTLPSCSLDKYIHKTGIIRCR